MLAKSFSKLLKKNKVKEVKIIEADTGKDPWASTEVPYSLTIKGVSEYGIPNFLKQFRNKKVLIKDAYDYKSQGKTIKVFKFYIHNSKTRK